MNGLEPSALVCTIKIMSGPDLEVACYSGRSLLLGGHKRDLISLMHHAPSLRAGEAVGLEHHEVGISHSTAVVELNDSLLADKEDNVGILTGYYECRKEVDIFTVIYCR